MIPPPWGADTQVLCAPPDLKITWVVIYVIILYIYNYIWYNYIYYIYTGAQIGLPRVRGSTSEPCTPNLGPSNPSRTPRTTSGFRRFLWKLMDFHQFRRPAGRRGSKTQTPLIFYLLCPFNDLRYTMERWGRVQGRA